MSAVTIAAGRTILKFILNLSLISQPCVLTAAIVVSEIIERLSPNIAPDTTALRQSGITNPVALLTPTAIGASATIVPTDVPMDKEIKHPIKNSPTTANWLGIKESPRYTVLSAPPAAVTAPLNAPAVKKMKHIVTTLSSPMPLVQTEILS